MRSTEPGRLAAHVLLDAASTFDSSAPEDESGRILNLAAARLAEVGCVTATIDDETDIVDVDASDLVGGACVLVSALVTRIAVATGLSREVVVSQTRDIIDKSI